MSAAQEVAMTMALEHSKAQSAYKRAFRQFTETLEPLDDETFWKLLDHFRNLLMRNLTSLPFVAKERAADELFRLPAFWAGCQRGTCGGGSDPGYTTLDAIRFAITYGEKKGDLYTPLFDTIEGRGDDGYGDLLDSLPILGGDLYKRCVGNGERSDFGHMESFVEACNKAAAALTKDVKQAEALVKFVLDGENYVEMGLMEEAERRFVNYAVDLERDRKGDDFDEDEHSEF